MVKTEFAFDRTAIISGRLHFFDYPSKKRAVLNVEMFCVLNGVTGSYFLCIRLIRDKI